VTVTGKMHCTVTTPESQVFDGDVRSVVVPAFDGEIAFLPGHAPLVGSLGFGELRVTSESESVICFFVDGGFVQVVDDHVIVLAASADSGAGLDRADEEAALTRLQGQRPGIGATFEERDAHQRREAVAKARLRIASRS
jgi:F-type H+-transporting ATPase subunit epsilon